MRSASSAYGVSLLLALGACGPTITMTDSVDLTWDFLPTLDRFHDDLHTPYVTGAHVLVYVSSDADKPDLAGWTVTSSDASVFALGTMTYDGLGLSATGVAGNAGDAELTILDEHGHEQGSGTVTVKVPDRIELDANAYLILNMPDDAPIGGARQLQGGEATYLVRYFAGTEELYGNQVP